MRARTALAHASKSLIRDPGTSALVILILSLGIATTVSVYSIVAGVVLRPLPYEAPEELVLIRQLNPNGYDFGASGPSFLDWQRSATTLESLAATSGNSLAILGTDADAPIRVGRSAVTAGFFRVLGARAVLGRLLVASDGGAEGPSVAVLSHGLWRERYGGDPGVVGRVIAVDGERLEVVGVAHPDVNLPRGTELWSLLRTDAEFFRSEMRGAHILGVFARLARGARPAVAQQELNGILSEVPGYDVTALVFPLKEHLVGDFRSPLLILLGAVGFVLLIACANAGALLLARATRRRRELAIRGAMGADTRRLTAQVMSESALLALAAGALGLLLASWLLDGLLALAPVDLPRVEEVGIDGGVLAFALMASVATGFLTGVIPTLRSRSVSPAAELKEGSARAGGRTGGVQAAFVVAEVALSVVLLVGAGLLVKSFVGITSIDPGFAAERVATFEVSLPEHRYAEASRVRRYYEELLDGVRALPAVTSAAVTRNLPASGSAMITPAVVEGRSIQDPSMVQISSVSEDYFETMGIPRLGGRTFGAPDTESAPPVAIVNQAFVDAYYDGEDPIGRRAHTFFGEQVMREIVGVVGTTSHVSLTEDPQPKFYYPMAQLPAGFGRLVIRTDAPLATLVPAVRAVAARVDPGVPLGEIATMRQLLARTTAEPRYYATTLSVFAALAALLALTGFFAVLSQAVSQRQREMGIRLAIGARPDAIVRLVVGDGMRLTVAGLVIGVAGALAAGRLLRNLLVGVEPTDPAVLVGVATILAVAALVAAWVPARRAASVDPMTTLRSE